MTLGVQIRDAVYTRLTQANSFSWGSTRKIPVPPIQQQVGQFPALGVYLIREEFNPDGDANTGPPRYIVDSLLGLTMIDLASKPDVLEGNMDTLVDNVLDSILCDYTFFNIVDSNGNPIIDSVPKILRQMDFPKDGDTQYVQCRLQLTARYFVIFPPTLKNNFNLAAITVQPPNQLSVAGQPVTYPANFLQEFETLLPQIVISTIGGPTNVAGQIISGTAIVGSSGAALGVVYIYDNGFALPIASAMIDSHGNWSVNITLNGLGSHSLVAMCADVIGNIGASAPCVFTLVIGTP